MNKEVYAFIHKIMMRHLNSNLFTHQRGEVRFKYFWTVQFSGICTFLYFLIIKVHLLILSLHSYFSYNAFEGNYRFVFTLHNGKPF